MLMRLLGWRRLRWFVIGGVVRAVGRIAVRRSTERSVDKAAAELEERLPAPVKRAIERVPADPIRAGGSAIVAGRTAKRAVTGTRRASRVAAGQVGRVADGIGRVRSVGDEIAGEAAASRRRLRAEYLRATRGNAAADEALLDLRDGSDALPGARGEPPPELDPPIRRGRWRAERPLGETRVNRVMRSYRPRPKAWDR